MTKNNNLKLYSILILGGLFIWGAYVLYANRPTSVSNMEVHKVLTAQKKETIQREVMMQKSVKNAPSKEIVQTPEKLVEKETKKLKPHHLYVKSDLQIRREFEQRRAESKKLRLKQKQRQKVEKLNQKSKRDGNV